MTPTLGLIVLGCLAAVFVVGVLVNPVSRRSLFGRALGAALMVTATPAAATADTPPVGTYVPVLASINPTTGAWTHLGAPLPSHGRTVTVRLLIEETQRP
jgi:hypothetical protein